MGKGRAIAERFRPRDQRGQSLIEMIIAVFLTGTLFLAVIAAVFTVVRFTDLNEKLQAVDSALVSYGEILQTQVPYLACPGSAGGASVVDAYSIGYVGPDGSWVYGADGYISGSPGVTPKWRRPNNVAVAVIDVRTWNPTTQEWNSGCGGAGNLPDSGVQLVRYQVTACPSTSSDPACPGGKVRFAEVTKRKPGPS